MKKTAALLLLLALSFTGCTRTGVEDVAFVTALGVDKTAEAWILSASLAEEEKHVISVDCASVAEGLETLQTRSAKKLYFGLTDVVLFGEEAARFGLSDSLDAFSRVGDFRLDLLPVVLRSGRADEALKAWEDASSAVRGLLRFAADTSVCAAVPLSSVLRAVSDDREGILLPCLAEGPSLAGWAAFNEEKLSAFLEAGPARAVTLLRGEGEKCALTLAEGTFILHPARPKLSFDNGRFELLLTGTAENVTDSETLDKLDRALADDAFAALSILQNARCDGVGLGKTVGFRAPEDWPDVFPVCPWRVTVRFRGEKGGGKR